MPKKVNPTVCAVMLTANRPEMAKRAVECFRAQTYVNKRMVILDARDNDSHPADGWGTSDDGREITLFSAPRLGLRKELTIGQLRQVVNLGAQRIDAKIIIHWDDDDYSHPNRIAEQVAFLQQTGADAVGYSQMLFWRENTAPHHLAEEPDTWTGDQAWLYTQNRPGYCLGTSFCYWREAWERRPFEHTSQGEDIAWLNGVKSMSQSSVSFYKLDPLMVARIHAGNTSTAYREMNRVEWERAPGWDSYCRSVME